MKNKIKKYAALCLVALMVFVNVVTYLPVKASTPEATNPAYELEFAGTGNEVYLLTPSIGSTTGKSVSISFDYYLAGSVDEVLKLEHYNGGSYYDFSDQGTGTNLLSAGQHTYSFQAPSYAKGNLNVTIKAAKASKVKLYIWNVSITLAGEEKFSTERQDWWGPNDTQAKKITYGDIPFNGVAATDPAYELEFAGTGNEIYLLTPSIGNTAGKSVSIYFDYYLAGSVDEVLKLEHYNGGSYYDFPDQGTGTNLLSAGQHTYSFQAPSYAKGNLNVTIKAAKASKVKLYIWNVSITLAGEEKFSTERQDWWGPDDTQAKKITYGDIPFNGVAATDPAYLIDFTGTTAGTGAFYMLTAPTYQSKNLAVTISFDYYLVDAADEELQVMNVAGGNYKDNATGSHLLYAGKHTFNYTVASNTGSTVSPAIQVTVAKASTAKLYIWNVTITRDGSSIFNLEAEQLHTDGPLPAVTTMTYGNIPFNGVAATDPAYLIDFTGTTAGTGAFYMLTAPTYQSKNLAVTISFDYYLVDAADEELQVMNVAGGNYKDNATGSHLLYAGKHTFNYTVASNTGSTVSPAIQVTVAKASTAKLYIWNVTITRDGSPIFNLEAEQLYTDGPLPTVTTMTYGEISFLDAVIGDINISGIIDVRDIVRLKKYLVDMATIVHEENIDVNSDGKVDDADIEALRRLILAVV